MDLLGVTFANATSAASIKYQTIVAETRTVSEFSYPQLLGRQIMLHPPRFFGAIFLPARTAEPADNATEEEAEA